MNEKYSKEFLDLLNSVNAKRSRTVINHILQYVSPSANRAKSWICEHCENWKRKDVYFCVKCFWAYPENYEHIAGTQQRIVSIVFTGDEIEDYERLIKISGIDNAQKIIKNILHEHLK